LAVVNQAHILFIALLLLQISGTIANTGHSVIFTVDNETIYNSYGSSLSSMGMGSSSSSSNMQNSNQIPVNLTGGPLSYRYRFHEIHIHYGLHDQFGSEHSVEGYTFPAEVSFHLILSLFTNCNLPLHLVSRKNFCISFFRVAINSYHHRGTMKQ
jgi:hypothetical protein